MAACTASSRTNRSAICSLGLFSNRAKSFSTVWWSFFKRARASMTSSWTLKLSTRRSGVQQPVPRGEAHEVGRGVHVQLAHDAPAVGLDRALADAELGSDVLVREAAHREVEDLALPPGEATQRRLRAPPGAAHAHVFVEDDARDAGREIRLAVRDGADGGE